MGPPDPELICRQCFWYLDRHRAGATLLKTESSNTVSRDARLETNVTVRVNANQQYTQILTSITLDLNIY